MWDCFVRVRPRPVLLVSHEPTGLPYGQAP